MTNKPFSAHCTNVFEETLMTTTEPRNNGAENLYFSQSQSRKVFDTTMTSISANPLPNYNVPCLTMNNNGDSALQNNFVNYAQPSLVAGGGTLFSFTPPQHNYLNMFNTGQNFNSYGHQQPNHLNYYQFTNKPNLFLPHQNCFPSTSPTNVLQENNQKEIPFKLQFHLQRSTSTSDLPEMKINNSIDEEMAFIKKMTELHNIWRDSSDMCSKLCHFDPFRKYGQNKILHLTKSPDLKAKKGKYYEIDISQECDVCQNNISQTLQLFENEKKGLLVNKNCINNGEKERIEKTTTATETSTDLLLKDEALQTESHICDKNVPMDVTDTEDAFLRNLKKSSVFDVSSSSLKNFKENYSDENIEEMLNKKVKNLLNYFPKSILKKFKLLDNEITNLLLKTMQMSDDGKRVYSVQDLEEIIHTEETGLQPKNFDRNLSKYLINKGRAEKRNFSEFGSDYEIFETNKVLRLTKSADLDTTSQNENDLEAPKELVDENIECKTLSDKSVSCKESISNIKLKSFDTKPNETICLDNKTKSENDVIDSNCISSQILSQADEQIQKWQDIILKKLQMFENGIREVFMNTKHFSLNCPNITEINSKNTDTVSYIGNFLDKIITLQKSSDILDKINRLEEEVTKTFTEKSKNDSMDLDVDTNADIVSKSKEENSKLIEEKPELIIPEESLRLNHGLEMNLQSISLENKLSPKCSTAVEMDFDNFNLKTSKRKLCEADPMVYSRSDYSTTKRPNVNVDFERKTVSENYIQGFWKTRSGNHTYTNNTQKNDENSADIKKYMSFNPSSFSIKKSVSEIINETHKITSNDNDDHTGEMAQVEQRRSISKIIDDIHTQIWGSDEKPTSKSHHLLVKDFKKNNSFDKYNHSVLILRPEFKSKTKIVGASSKHKFLENDRTDFRKKLSSLKSKLQEQDTCERRSNMLTKSKFLDDFQTNCKTLSPKRNLERSFGLSSKSKFLEDFEMSKSIVDSIINKVTQDSDTKQFQKKDDNKTSSIPEDVVRKSKSFQKDLEKTIFPIKSKSLTSINEETEVTDKSTDHQINLWQNNIPRAFANENKELSRSKMYLFDNWRKKLQENKGGTRGSKSNLYQRPSFKKKVPRALLTDDNNSKTEIELSLETYDKSTREMEKKLNEALQRYNITAQETEKISKKFTTSRTFLEDNTQRFLTKVENVLKAKLDGNFKIGEVQSDRPCRDNSTMEPSMSFDDEEIRSVEYSRSFVIRNTDEADDDNNSDEKLKKNKK